MWWDLHDWSQTDDVPAVVGSFPEPFLNGTEGKRLPVRVECAAAQSAPCRTVIARLRALGVPAAVAAIGSGAEPDALQVVVGQWTAVHGDPSVTGIESGPRTSGVYARFASNGQTLTLLGGNGSTTATLTTGAGLIAATKDDEGAIVWVVTGTDEAGVQRAAAGVRRKLPGKPLRAGGDIDGHTNAGAGGKRMRDTGQIPSRNRCLRMPGRAR